MKRLAILAVTAVTALAPLAAAPAYAAPPRGYEQDQQQTYDRRDDRRDDKYDARADRRDAVRNEHRDRRSDSRREARNEQRWDHRQHNGYTVNGRWYFGPPPTSYYNRSDFRPGYEVWRRGQRVPDYYRDRALRVDYRQYRDMRAPPRGYHYVRDDRGTVLLVGIATGVILSTILAQ